MRLKWSCFLVLSDCVFLITLLVGHSGKFLNICNIKDKDSLKQHRPDNEHSVNVNFGIGQ